MSRCFTLEIQFIQSILTLEIQFIQSILLKPKTWFKDLCGNLFTYITIVSCICRQHVMCRHVPLTEPRNPGHMHCLDPFAYMPVRTKKTIKGMLVPWQPRLIQLKITSVTDRTFLPLTDDNDGFHFTWSGMKLWL